MLKFLEREGGEKAPMISTLKSKRGLGLEDVSRIALTLFVVGIVIAVAITVIVEMKDNIESTDANASIDDIVSALGDLTDWMDIIVLVAIAAIILGLIFLFGRGRSM